MHFAHCESCHRAFVQRQPVCCAACATKRDDAPQPVLAPEAMLPRASPPAASPPAASPPAASPPLMTNLETLARAFAVALDLAPATQLAELQAALRSAADRQGATATMRGEAAGGIAAVCESLAHARRGRTATTTSALPATRTLPRPATRTLPRPATRTLPRPATHAVDLRHSSAKDTAARAHPLAPQHQALVPSTLPLAAPPPAAPAAPTHWLTALISATLDAALVQYMTSRTAHAITAPSCDLWPGPLRTNAAAA